MKPAGEPLGDRAIVIGGGVAGLLAARALAPHFERVTLLERDRYPDGRGDRKGIPQGRHVHAILAQGVIVLDKLFPGISREMAAAGAVPIDAGRDLRWYLFGGYKPQIETGIRVLLFSRAFLEENLLRRLRAIPNVEIRDGEPAEGLAFTSDRTRITGVRVSASDGRGADLPADLVVDASGRGSRSPRWLQELGYPTPKELEIGIDLRYASRFYRRRPNDLEGARAIYVVPKPPQETRGGAALPVDGDRWLVSLQGYFGDHPPIDEDGFLAFARRLPVPDIYDLIKRLEPLTAPAVYNIPASIRRRYEAMTRSPERYVVVGDAVAAFNPIFAQGMTVALLEAERLALALQDARKKSTLDGTARRFLRREGWTVELPWRLAAHEDFRYPQTRGRRTLGTSLANWYVGRMHEVSEHDVIVYRAFLQALHMVRSPMALFGPRVLLRVLQGRRAAAQPDAARI